MGRRKRCGSSAFGMVFVAVAVPQCFIVNKLFFHQCQRLSRPIASGSDVVRGVTSVQRLATATTRNDTFNKKMFKSIK